LSLLMEQRSSMNKDGKSASAVVASARPPVFFTRKALVERVLSGTQVTTIVRYLDKLQMAVLDSRKNAALSDAICHRTLLAIAVEQNRMKR
jgi:DNA polymerase III subunit delta